MRKIYLIIITVFVSACGDFPSYDYEQTDDYCVMSFPFAGGLIGRKYVGYLNVVSTLQYLDANPEVEIFIGEPSHIELEEGSVQKLEIDGQTFRPQFKKTYLHGELGYYGPAFLFDKEVSTKIYSAYREGSDLTIHGRLEVGQQYETEIYNFFFDSNEKDFKKCINRLLDEGDLAELAANGVRDVASEVADSDVDSETETEQ